MYDRGKVEDMNLFIQINKKILNGYATYVYTKMKIKVIEKISKLLKFFFHVETVYNYMCKF